MKRELALSEVIGFLMIIALLGILFSMYLLYVVPIQGKDAEIAHMKYVQQQFIDLKSDIDSLIINERVNVPIARSFELGTLASTGQGSLSILPIQGFIEAAGTLVVNQQMDNVTIQGEFLTGEKPMIGKILESPPENTDIPALWVDGDHLYLNYPGTKSVNNTVRGTVSLVNTTYTIVNNLTEPVTEEKYYGHFRIYNQSRNIISELKRGYDLDPYWTDPLANLPNIASWMMNGSKNASGNNTTDYITINNQSDIIFEFYNTSEENATTLQYTRTLQENATTSPHIFDLAKINEIISTDPQLLNYTLSGDFSGGYGEPEWEYIDQPAQPLGSLQYWSQNRYWINQELLYEMGGLFLKQNEGVSIMLIPALSITPVDTPSGPNIRVSLVDVSITDTNDVSGSKSCQIFAKVDSIQKNKLLELTEDQLNVKTLMDGQPNAKFVAITFRPQHIDDDITTRLWKRAFDQIKVITQKTMSERGINYNIDKSMTTLYDQRSEHLSATLFIGSNITDHLSGLSYTDGLEEYIRQLKSCAEDTSPDHSGAKPYHCIETQPLKPFFFDYTKAKTSLVIQSGAL